MSVPTFILYVNIQQILKKLTTWINYLKKKIYGHLHFLRTHFGESYTDCMFFSFGHNSLLFLKLRKLKTISSKNRSSYRKCSIRKKFINFVKFIGKHLCQSLFFNKLADLSLQLYQMRLWQRCAPVNFAKFPKRPFLQNTY